jgi:GTP cyclohydrolase I
MTKKAVILNKFNKKVRVEAISKLFGEIMKALNLDLTDPSLKDTPKRVAKMYVEELCSAHFTKPPKLTTFPVDSTNDDQMVIVRDISIHSMCEHHFLPFIGTCHIAYFPKDKLLGLSKFNRTSQYFGNKPQVQERLTNEIANFLKKGLGTEDIAVVITAKHLCCAIRGVHDPNSDTLTSSLGGKFREQPVRSELFNLLNLGKK